MDGLCIAKNVTDTLVYSGSFNINAVRLLVT